MASELSSKRFRSGNSSPYLDGFSNPRKADFAEIQFRCGSPRNAKACATVEALAWDDAISALSGEFCPQIIPGKN